MNAHNQELISNPPLFLAPVGSFHGKLAGSVQLTYNPIYRVVFAALAAQARFVPTDVPGALDEIVRAERRSLHDLVVDGDQVRVVERPFPVFCAFVLEPILGEGGIHELPLEFAREIQRVATELDVPVVIDEIQTGMGRTGAFLASTHLGLQGDYYTMAKSLGGGIAKAAVMLVRQSRYQRDFEMMHSSTFAKDSFSCQIARKVLDILEADDGAFYRLAAQRGDDLLAELRTVQQEFPEVIKDVRGRGLIVGLELHDQSGSPSVALREIHSSGFFGYYISGYLLREHAIRTFPTSSAVYTLRFETLGAPGRAGDQKAGRSIARRVPPDPRLRREAAGADRGEIMTETSEVEMVTPEDPRYGALTASFNARWSGTPDYVLLPTTTDEVVEAVQHVVDSGARFALHSSGACYEDLITNPEIQVNISTSRLASLDYDPTRSAFAVGPGITTAELYRKLYEGWHVTVPAGVGPPVALGGQLTNAGYGPLARSLGLLVDYLEAVEVVVVDDTGRARKVVAGRHADDPNRDLWWAHTGGGGGTYGVVTRFWLRSPDAQGGDPADQLPAAPRELVVSEVAWSWDGMTEASFSRLLRNFSAWHERNADPGSPYVNLFSALKPRHVSASEFLMSSQIDATTPAADKLLDDFLAAVSDGTGLTGRVDRRERVDWLGHVTSWAGLGGDGWEDKGRFKAKSAYLRTAFPDDQLKTMYRYLTDPEFDNPATLVEIAGYGGRVNAVAPSATAVAQRDSAMKLLYLVMWETEEEDAAQLAWIRRWYADLYASTGGVPGINGVNDGAILNYTDTDHAYPAPNSTGIPWHTLYFKNAYQPLQHIKAKWDPGDHFTHALAVRKPH